MSKQSIPSLYTNLTTVPKDKDIEGYKSPLSLNQEEDAARFQARQLWLQSSITRELKDNLDNEIGQLLRDAVALSVSYPSHKNADKIIQNLIRVDCLKKIQESYSKLNNK